MDKKEIKNTDTFTLGGKEITSRFILGSGKFSLDLVKACVEKAGAQIITLALRRANEGGLANILDYIPEDVIFFRIHQEPEMQKKRYVLPDFPEKSDAEISSKWKL